MANVKTQTAVADTREPNTLERNGAASLSDRVQSLRLDGRGTSNRSASALIPWGLSVILLLMTAGFGFRTYKLNPPGDEPAANTSETRKRDTDSVPVNVASGQVASSGAVALQAKGYVIPAHQIQVSPNKVSGILEFISPRLEEGNVFQEGEELARLQNADFKARRDKALTTRDEARRRLEELKNTWPKELEEAQAKVNAIKAKAEYSRVKRQISNSTRNATSTEERAEAEAQYNQDLANITAAEAAYRVINARGEEQIKQAEFRIAQTDADLTENQWMLDNCVIRAPVTGTILKKSAERGNFVNPSALSGGAGGIAVSLCEMADLTDLEVDLKIQERDIANVVVGQRCTVMPEAYQNFEPFRRVHPNGYVGIVSRMMPTADRSQGAIPVRVKIQVPKDEQGKYLRPDMGVVVNFLKGE